MRVGLASSIMPRTTLDLDASVLRSVKRLARAAGKSLGEVVSELLAVALDRQQAGEEQPRLKWRTQAMSARVDLEDKEAVARALER